jgi:hypothetical protein
MPLPVERSGGADVEQKLFARIQAEFREMPGLTLTLRQAARLFDVDTPMCARVLELLQENGALRRQGDVFSSAGEGRWSA